MIDHYSVKSAKIWSNARIHKSNFCVDFAQDDNEDKPKNYVGNFSRYTNNYHALLSAASPIYNKSDLSFNVDERTETSSNQKPYPTPARRSSNTPKSMASIYSIQMHKTNFPFNVPVEDESIGSYDSREDDMIPFKDIATFRALPNFVTRYLSSQCIAFLGMVIVLGSILQVIVVAIKA